MDDWQRICPMADLEIGHGVTALVHGQAIAVFHAPDGSVHALGNYDPFAHAAVLARGILGVDAVGVPFVGNPLHGHRFDLRTGACVDDPHVKVPVYEVKVEEGFVFVGRRMLAQAS